MNDTFSNWLSSGDVLPCCFQEKGFWYILIRVEKNADFEYLYSLNRERKDVPTRGSSFEYAGIYYRKDGLLYDAQYSLTSIEDDPEPLRSRRAEALQELLKAAVRKKVEAAVGNDRKNLRITELTDAALLNNLDYTVRHGAKAAARRLYLDTAEFEHCERKRIPPVQYGLCGDCQETGEVGAGRRSGPASYLRRRGIWRRGVRLCFRQTAGIHCL